MNARLPVSPTPSLHLALIEPEIHWNTGNVGRTCLALGASLHLVGPMGFSLDEKQVKRAGLDYWPRVDLHRWQSWQDFEGELPRLGSAYFFSAEAERSLWEVDFRVASTLVFGRESVGLDQHIRERYRERLVALPMVQGSVRSLNLSTCAAIAAYEVRRQQHALHSAASVSKPD